MRPLCGAARSINGPLSNVVSEILNKMADILDKEIETESRSTEDMVAGIEGVNQKTPGDLVVFSMDVDALYPNLKAKEVAREIAAAFTDIELDIDVDIHQLGLYLLLVLGKKELKKQGLALVCPTRKATAGTECGITTAEVMGGPDCESKHNPAKRRPTAGQRRKMISLALDAGIIAVMTHHVYSYNDKTRLQTERGPIGLELSGAVARVFMLLWDRKLLKALHRATLHLQWDLFMYLSYVDDSNTACNILPLGARLVRGKVRVLEEKVEEDRQTPGDLRTARIVQQIANNICPFIQMTVDCPSK